VERKYMAKFKTYDYRQRVFLPVSLADQLMPGTLGFAIHTLVETRLDTSAFEQKYRNDETGRAAYNPKILLKIVLLGYARGLISSRKIERACRENVVFIALAEPVFANLRTQTRLDRFTLRGKVRVNIQWLLYCMIHNIEKIANYGLT
jgi:transposase